jgi:predicted Zn-dependent protease
MKNWDLDQLKSALSARSDVKGWVVTQEHVHRRERYFMSEGQALAVDQDRDVHSLTVHARIFVKLNREGRQGEILQKLFPALPLKPQIEAAIESAMQTDHQAWELPTDFPRQAPSLATTDPRIAEDIERAMAELTEEISGVVSKKRPSAFNSAELFLSSHDLELHLSNGLIHRSSQSRIYSEAAYSMSRKGKDGKNESDEYLNTAWSVSTRDLSVEKLFDEAAERAEHSLDVKKPVTGKYPVIVDAEVLATLLNGYIGQLSAFNAYQRLPYMKPGQEFIPDAFGDLLDLSLDPTLEYGAATVAFSEQGSLQKPLKVVDKNRVMAALADKQYSDYLKTPVTTARGNLVVGLGGLSLEELKRREPQVIEILQFSALFPDPNSGTFSSEIRLARLHDNVTGKTSYLKGGSLSGSIAENFRGIRFSNRAVKKAHFASGGSGTGQGYFGPEYALLTDVSIVG